MRPIWMKLKGINSFQEAQEIDFEVLTSQGLFGIFGPTGSGKSSILDGMTLALYGTTARNSGDFINVNTDRASIDYMFSVKEKREHIYRVSRSFKRSKEGSIRSDGAKFIELLGEEQEILADRVGTVNEKCREILGLSREDFFRTVVLPQGKFSEFLKLEGMERNKMLERLFHLEKYGEELVALIKARQARWEGQKKEKEGALSRYAEVSEEGIENLKKAEKEYETLLKAQENKIKKRRAALEEDRKIFQLQREYEALLTQQQELDTKREEILKIQEEIKEAEKANQLFVYLEDARQAKEREKESSQKQKKSFAQWQEKQMEAEALKVERVKLEQLVQIQKPGLELEKAKLEDAVKLGWDRQKQQQQLEIRQQEAETLRLNLEEDHKKMEGLLKDIEERRQKKLLLTEELKEVEVPAETQRMVEEGFRVAEDIDRIQKRIADSEKKRAGLEAEKQKTEMELSQLLTLEKNLKAEKIKTQQNLCRELEQALETVRKQFEESSAVKADCEKFYIENLASFLAADLKEGEPCPVCGSCHHVTVFRKQEQQDFNHLQKQKEEAEQAFQHLSGEVTRIETKLEHEKIILKKLEEQEQEFGEEIQSILTQKAGKEADIKNLEIRIKEEEREKSQAEAEEQERKLQYQELQKACKRKDLVSAYGEIQQKNKCREEKQTLLGKLETALDARIKNREKGEQIIQEKERKKAELQVLMSQIEGTVKELERQIQEKAGSLDSPEKLKKRCKEITEKIQNMDREYSRTSALWEQLQKEEGLLRQQCAAQEALANSAKADAKKKQQIFTEKMQEFEVTEENWILNAKRTEEVLQTAGKKVETFRELIVQLKTQLDRTQKQLQGKSVLKEELEKLEQEVINLEESITEQNKNLGAVKKEREQQEKAWKEQQGIQKQLKEIYHKLDILSELDGLFKGKRFVEYVSRYYLEYVSREADERLKEMTGSSYGLETDGNGMFVIRDYKNGGVSRPASTLSGGETFMASLALALALSAQIQMKGAAPLELFFLDEGFGTLDETCLEVVMESLEKIRNKRRSVGVITHVEEIKARIPMRLVVEPAKIGEGGSKLHIEEA